MANWKQVKTDNVRMVFVCPNCKKEHTRTIILGLGFFGAYTPACYCDNVYRECKPVGLEVEVEVEEKS